MATNTEADSKEQNGHKIESKIDEISQKKLEAGKLRSKVIDELLQTEKTYVECLDNLIRQFKNPLQNKIKGKLFLSHNAHKTIFPSDINTIYGFHSLLMVELAKTTANWNNNSSKIGNIFVKYGQMFKMYQNYMNNHEKASLCLTNAKNKNSKFSEWCIKTREKCNNYDIHSLLILPIQRIPRYQLLLKELIKRTVEYDKYHTDLYDLRNAFDSITEVATLINDRMKENDKRQKVSLIESRFDRYVLQQKMGENLVTPARYFVCESSDIMNDECIIKHNKHGTQSMIVLFLFNDCLIYGHLENGAMKSQLSVKNLFLGKDKIAFDDWIKFDEIFRLEDIGTEEYKGLHCLKLHGRAHSLWVSFRTIECKYKWMTLMTECNTNVAVKTIKSQTNKNKYNIDIAYPLFVPDDYSDKCLICESKFSLLNRRHHCYYCGNLACSKCTDYRLKSAWKKNEIVRVCVECHGVYQYQMSGDIPPAKLPSSHRASIWETKDGYNLDSFDESDTNIRAILSPNMSPVVTCMNGYGNASAISIASAMNELVTQTQSDRVEVRRRKQSLKNQQFNVSVIEEGTPIVTPVETVNENDGLDNSYAMIEQKEFEIKIEECMDSNENENGMIDLTDDVSVSVSDCEEKDFVVQSIEKIQEIDKVYNEEHTVGNIEEIHQKECDEMENIDLMCDESYVKNNSRNVLVIGGIVLVGFAIVVALNRKRFRI